MHTFTRQRLTLFLQFLVAVILFASLSTTGAVKASDHGPMRPVSPEDGSGHTALLVENVGQFTEPIRFQWLNGPGQIWLADDAIWLNLVEEPAILQHEGHALYHTSREQDEGQKRGVVLKLTFPDANPDARLEVFGRSDAHISYLIGSNPEHWHADVPVWTEARYRNLYPGVDLVIGSRDDSIHPAQTWRFEMGDKTILDDIRIQVEGMESAIIDGGVLRIATNTGGIDLPLPGAIGKDGVPRSAPLVLTTVQPDILEILDPNSKLDSGAPLQSSTVTAGATDLVYGTYVGGGSWEYGNALAVNDAGETFVTGETFSANFPVTPGAYDTNLSQIDAFVAKLDATGSNLIYATYLGGSDTDKGWGIALEGSNAYVTGETRSDDFPVTRDEAREDSDIFVTKLNANGTSLEYATRLGGGFDDTGWDVAVTDGTAYVAGGWWSADTNEDGDAFVTKLNTAGTDVYTTLIGESDDTDAAFGINLHNGNIYIVGETYASSFPLAGNTSGGSDGFLAKLSSSGVHVASTLLGGSVDDAAYDVDVATNGQSYVTGYTKSSNFPVTTAGTLSGSSDAFVVQLDVSGGVSYGAYLGGSGNETGRGIALDMAAGIHIVGDTSSSDFPTTAGAYQTGPGGSYDAFIVRKDLSNSAPEHLSYSTYLGGTSFDQGWGVAVDNGGNSYAVGLTNSTNFPTSTGAYDTSHNGSDDVFLSKLALILPPQAPTVVIDAMGDNVSLTWPAITQDIDTKPIEISHYNVWRSVSPYFVPGDASSPTAFETQETNYMDNGILINPNGYYYIVTAVAVAGPESDASNQTGAFTFSLTPGG